MFPRSFAHSVPAFCLTVLLAVVFAGCGTSPKSDAPVELSSTVSLYRIYGDGMVLQRNREIRIAGQADPGKFVEVRLGGSVSNSIADANGRFVATFPPRGAGEPLTLTVRSRDQQLVLNDILVGEVWLGSGQSNMEWTVKNSMNFAQEKAEAENPMIRHYTVPKYPSPGVIPVDIKEGRGWQKASSETVGGFSAVLYFFAKNLQRELGVPVGIINSSWGGTAIEPWISANAFESAGEKDMVRRSSEIVPEGDRKQQEAEFRARFSAWEKSLEKDYARQVAAASGWMSRDFDDKQWKQCDLPAAFGDIEIDGNGAAWFRKRVVIPSGWAGRDLVLSLGVIDDCDDTWLNGKLVGQTTSAVESYWSVPRRYRIPAKDVAVGENVIAVRVLDHAYSGGFMGEAKDMHISLADDAAQRISLAGDWRAKVEFLINWDKTASRPTPPSDGNKLQGIPSALFNGMIANIQMYPIQGVLWYQGESNAGDARMYAKRFPLLIESWRREWADKNQTFIFAQLAAFQRHTPGKPLPEGFLENIKPAQANNWSLLRESQTAALRLPNTGMAVCIDIGDPIDIHPTNKQEVGRRMAMEALRLAHGRDIVSAGPLYKGMTVEGGAIRIHFSNVGLGLESRGGDLRQFAIAGEDGVFHWAKARIENGTVLVSSPEVKAPRVVRYAWAMYPAGCNLYNREGFPASPFRTDMTDSLR